MNELNDLNYKCELEIAYYIGAYGPSIRIAVSSKEILIILKDKLQKLANGEMRRFDLHGYPSVRIDGFHELILESCPDDNDYVSEKTVHVVSSGEGKITINWSCSLAGWSRSVGLLDGILMQDIPCHQYLSMEGIDDALIIVTYRE